MADNIDVKNLRQLTTEQVIELLGSDSREVAEAARVEYAIRRRRSAARYVGQLAS
jgi:hypothetical protein